MIISGGPLSNGVSPCALPSSTVLPDDPLQTPLDDAGTADAECEVREFTIAAETHGKRLDQALALLVPEFSRSYLQRLIEEGAVSLAQAVVTKPAQRVQAGTRGRVEMRPTEQSQAFKAELIPIVVLYQDAHVLVVNKPAGLVVHPAPGNWTGTLLNGLLALDTAAASLPRAGIVHRLDKDTSGLMVVARSRLAMEGLVRKIAAREVSRKYLAITDRPWIGAHQVDVENAIGRDPANRLRMAVVDGVRNAGKPAKTTLRQVAVHPSEKPPESSGTLAADSLRTQSNTVSKNKPKMQETASLVLCTLHSGRTHQIRVHMAHQGMPLVGDAVYGGSTHLGMARQALHAWKLAFLHPVTQQPHHFEAPVPDDMVQLSQRLGLRYNATSLAARSHQVFS